MTQRKLILLWQRGQGTPQCTDRSKRAAYTNRNRHTRPHTQREARPGGVLHVVMRFRLGLCVCSDDGPANRWTGVYSLGYRPSACHTALPTPQCSSTSFHSPSTAPFAPFLLNCFMLSCLLGYPTSPPSPALLQPSPWTPLSFLLFLNVLWQKRVCLPNRCLIPWFSFM